MDISFGAPPFTTAPSLAGDGLNKTLGGFPQRAGPKDHLFSQQHRPGSLPTGAESCSAVGAQSLGIKARWEGCNQGKLPGGSGKLTNGLSDPPERRKEE